MSDEMTANRRVACVVLGPVLLVRAAYRRPLPCAEWARAWDAVLDRPRLFTGLSPGSSRLMAHGWHVRYPEQTHVSQ